MNTENQNNIPEQEDDVERYHTSETTRDFDYADGETPEIRRQIEERMAAAEHDQEQRNADSESTRHLTLEAQGKETVTDLHTLTSEALVGDKYETYADSETYGGMFLDKNREQRNLWSGKGEGRTSLLDFYRTAAGPESATRWEKIVNDLYDQGHADTGDYYSPTDGTYIRGIFHADAKGHVTYSTLKVSEQSKDHEAFNEEGEEETPWVESFDDYDNAYDAIDDLVTTQTIEQSSWITATTTAEHVTLFDTPADITEQKPVAEKTISSFMSELVMQVPQSEPTPSTEVVETNPFSLEALIPITTEDEETPVATSAEPLSVVEIPFITAVVEQGLTVDTEVQKVEQQVIATEVPLAAVEQTPPDEIEEPAISIVATPEQPVIEVLELAAVDTTEPLSVVEIMQNNPPEPIEIESPDVVHEQFIASEPVATPENTVLDTRSSETEEKAEETQVEQESTKAATEDLPAISIAIDTTPESPSIYSESTKDALTPSVEQPAITIEPIASAITKENKSAEASLEPTPAITITVSEKAVKQPETTAPAEIINTQSKEIESFDIETPTRESLVRATPEAAHTPAITEKRSAPERITAPLREQTIQPAAAPQRIQRQRVISGISITRERAIRPSGTIVRPRARTRALISARPTIRRTITTPSGISITRRPSIQRKEQSRIVSREQSSIIRAAMMNKKNNEAFNRVKRITAAAPISISRTNARRVVKQPVTPEWQARRSSATINTQTTTAQNALYEPEKVSSGISIALAS